MKIEFIGGADEIGASSVLLTTEDKKFLIDAGIRMNLRSGRDKVPDYSQIGKPDAVFLTHAHTDHSGALPVVNRHTKNSPIFMTHGTFQLCTVLFKDALKIMQADREDEVPAYDEQEVAATFKNIRQIRFFRSFIPAPGIRVTFFPAGHILGAACIFFESASGTVLFTGDYSVTKQIAVSGAMVSVSPDIVITEATYGGRHHIERKKLEYECILKAKEVLERGGKILIPAFAVGRSQEMILLLRDAMSRKIIPETDIFVDGMINSVNLVYENNPDGLPASLRSVIRAGQSPFYTGFIQRVTPPERGKILKRDRPAVIISSSGMLAGGPSVFYAKELLKHEKNALFVSGYQDEESPGRRLLELEPGKTLTLDGKTVTVKAEVYRFSFSAHADESQIVTFVNALSPDQVVLVHGDDGARESLADQFMCKNVHLPVIGETLEFRDYEHSLSIPDQDGEETDITPDGFWKECLHNGVSRVSVREIEELFPGRPEEIEALGGFRPDYRDRNFYSVLKAEKREDYLRRKKLWDGLGDLRGKAVIYGQQHNFNLGLCTAQDPENMAFHMISSKKGKPKTRIDVSRIIRSFDTDMLQEESDPFRIRMMLKDLEKQAKSRAKKFRKQLGTQGGSFTAEEAGAFVGAEGLADEIAVIAAFIPVAEKDESGRWHIRPDAPCGAPAHEKAPSPAQPQAPRPKTDNINQIQDRIRNKLKPWSLKKVSYQGKNITLEFDFPDGINHAEVLEAAKSVTPEPYTVGISPKVNQSAFNPLLYPYLGSTGKISLIMNEKQVVVKNNEKPLTQKFKQKFTRTTGFTLSEKTVTAPVRTASGLNQQDILNQCRACLPERFRSVKVGVRENTVLLKADFPDVLLRECPGIMDEIRAKIGMDVEVPPPPPNTALLISILKNRIIFEGNPSVDLENRVVTVGVAVISEKIKAEILEETGFVAGVK